MSVSILEPHDSYAALKPARLAYSGPVGAGIPKSSPVGTVRPTQGAQVMPKTGS